MKEITWKEMKNQIQNMKKNKIQTRRLYEKENKRKMLKKYTEEERKG